MKKMTAFLVTLCMLAALLAGCGGKGGDNGLDPTGIAALRELLIKLNTEKKVTIIISSHILGELHKLATCYGFLHAGTLIEQITAEELDAKTKDIETYFTDMVGGGFIG